MILKTKRLSVPVASSRSSSDGYIDDLVIIVIDSPNLRERAENTIHMMFHILFRPLAVDEPIIRSDLLSLRKSNGEGILSEIRIVLGWEINSK